MANAYVPLENGSERCICTVTEEIIQPSVSTFMLMSYTTVFPKTGTPNNPLANFATLFLESNLRATESIVLVSAQVFYCLFLGKIIS